jgi:iron(III) transport system permease protein
LMAAAAVVALAMAAPVVHLLAAANDAHDPLGQVMTARIGRLVWSTLRLAFIVTGLTLVLGVGVAWLVERTDVPGRRLLGLTAALPLVVPTYVGALALVAAVGPSGLAWELPGMIGFWGAVTSLALATYPYVFLTSRAALQNAEPALEDAARSLGDRRWSVFRRVLLPQLRPATAVGGLLVFLYVLSDFGAVAIMRVDTLTRAIFLEYRSSFDRGRPAVLALVLVALTLVAIVAEQRLRGRGAPARAVAGVAPAPPVRLGRWRWPVAGALAALPLAGVGIPVGVLAYWSSVGATRADRTGVLARAALNSVELSIAAALVALLAALPVAFLAVRHRSRFSRVVEALSVSGYALPGLVIGLALVFFGSRFMPAIYQTATLVVIAYVVRFVPESLGAVRASLQQVDPALEEAGRSLGRTRMGVTRTVTIPLIRGGMVAGAALVFLTAMKELPATLLLRPAGEDTLAVRVWTGASQGLYGQAAPAALLLVAVTVLLLWPLYRQGSRRRPLLTAPGVAAG